MSQKQRLEPVRKYILILEKDLANPNATVFTIAPSARSVEEAARYAMDTAQSMGWECREVKKNKRSVTILCKKNNLMHLIQITTVP